MKGFSTEDEFDSRRRAPDRHRPIGDTAEDIFLHMRAHLAWDARVFGLCRLDDLLRAKQRAERAGRVRVNAAALFRDFFWGHDFAGWPVRMEDDVFGRPTRMTEQDWAELRIPIDEALADLSILADGGRILLVAGPFCSGTDWFPNSDARFSGSWVSLHFPRVIGLISPA